MPKAEPYLLLGGAELLNSLRTLTYLRRGLGGARYEVRLARPLTPEAGYSDTYGDEYEADPYWPGNLLCYCALLDTGPFVSPAMDPAPWYDSSRPESGDFFGILGDVTIGEVAVRSASPRSSGGATIGRQRLRPRILQFRGIMHAASPAAMAYAERWLSQRLAGDAEGCVEAEAELLLACPPDDAAEPESYLRHLIEVGLVDGPVFEGVSDIGQCFAQAVSFQLAAGSPWLRAPAEDCIELTNLNVDPAPCCTMLGPGAIGDAAARITVHAGHIGSSVQDLTITATWDSTCPSAAAPDVTYSIDRVPRGCALVIDSSTRSITVTDELTGEVVGGPDALDLSGIIPWVVAAPGEAICICVDASAASFNAGTLVGVERIGREL